MDTSKTRRANQPKKGRNLVIKNGKIEENIRFKIGTITMSEEPVKCLGKWYDGEVLLDESKGVKIREAQVP